ncbi:uncharacterized protein [Branchiostoma lanceolatum]|uniref:uncharacterized protein n=1 Tax=Branchiostoma lanceolatum TaxID=7740 RepID=UPI00345269BC
MSGLVSRTAPVRSYRSTRPVLPIDSSPGSAGSFVRDPGSPCYWSGCSPEPDDGGAQSNPARGYFSAASETSTEIVPVNDTLWHIVRASPSYEPVLPPAVPLTLMHPGNPGDPANSYQTPGRHHGREAKTSRGDLTVVWLDLANAYGSIPHALIQVALDHYHVPAGVKGMISSYFGGVQLRFRTADFTTQWQSLEKGIVTGCTISPILFIMGMNLLIDAAASKAKGPRMMSGARQNPLRGFMDDLTVTTVSHIEARWMIAELDLMATWARMKFKPKKSRCMVIKKGKITSRFKLEVQGEPIPSIEGNPIKCLGKSGQMQLPFASVVEEYKVAKCRTVMLYRDSQDQQVRQAGVATRAGRKFQADALVSKAEGMLILRDIIGITNTGRQGLGSSHFQQWGKASRKERGALIQTEVRQLEEEGRRAKAVELATQGAWTKWNLPSRKITWSELWKLEPFRISFLLRSVYDTLPSATNLCKWGLREDPACKLCGERGTMAHILSGCKTALSQGRYRWRHDRVLTTIASILEVERKKKRHLVTRRGPAVTFVKEGEKSRPATARAVNNILQKAKSWDLKVDLGRRLHFPSVVQTNLGPDAVLWSEEGKKIVIIELTVP